VLLFFSLSLALCKHLIVADILNGCSRNLITEDFRENYKADSARVWLVILSFAYLLWSDLAATLPKKNYTLFCAYLEKRRRRKKKKIKILYSIPLFLNARSFE
jgi:hypothetical protein